jgi:hypothetical protein
MKSKSLESINNRKFKTKECEIKDYHCGYCGNDFEFAVKKGGDGHNTYSSVVQCRNCKNFLETWEE